MVETESVAVCPSVSAAARGEIETEMIDGATVKVRFTDLCCAGTNAVGDRERERSRIHAVVGVPAITPVEGVKDKPAGNEPAVIDQVSGEVPPAAANVAV